MLIIATTIFCAAHAPRQHMHQHIHFSPLAQFFCSFTILHLPAHFDAAERFSFIRYFRHISFSHFRLIDTDFFAFRFSSFLHFSPFIAAFRLLFFS